MELLKRGLAASASCAHLPWSTQTASGCELVAASASAEDFASSAAGSASGSERASGCESADVAEVVGEIKWGGRLKATLALYTVDLVLLQADLSLHAFQHGHELEVSGF